jgi:hypothetical protein
MKSITSILGAAAIAVLMSAPAMAQGMIPSMGGMNVPQYTGVPWASGMPNPSAFNHWASEHHKAAAELQANPGLMYDPAWRKRHPHFQHFIEAHPEDWAALKQGGTRYYNSGFNNYLANNPSAAAQLRQNPELLYDPAFRRANPGITNYMSRHPNLWGNTPMQMAPAAAGPWTNGLPNQSAYNHWAAEHSKSAAELQANPNLMNDPAWRKRHPHFQHFIETHPEDWAALKHHHAEYMKSHPNMGQSAPYNHHHAEEMAETPAQEQAEHHGKHWEHEEKKQQHQQEKAQRHAQHQQKWQEKHGDTDAN